MNYFNEIPKTASISKRVLTLKLCVPLNHLVISEGCLCIAFAKLLLFHPFAFIASSIRAAKCINLSVFSCSAPVISESKSATTALSYSLLIAVTLKNARAT